MMAILAVNKFEYLQLNFSQKKKIFRQNLKSKYVELNYKLIILETKDLPT